MSGLVFTSSLLDLFMILSLSEGYSFGDKSVYCGEELKQMIALMCEVYYDEKEIELSGNNVSESLHPIKISRYEPDEDGELPYIEEAEDECCRKPCSPEEIAKFCPIEDKFVSNNSLQVVKSNTFSTGKI